MTRIFALAMLAALLTGPMPSSAAEQRVLADALAPGRPTCHARVFDAGYLAAHPDRRVTGIALERTAGDLAAERKWGRHEQFDDTPVVSAILRVRLRGDPVAHSARLECTADDSALVCTNPGCEGGQIRLVGEGRGALALLVGGALKSGRFIGHYLHLDESCEGRADGPVVLESGSDDRNFSLLPAPKQACR